MTSFFITAGAATVGALAILGIGFFIGLMVGLTVRFEENSEREMNDRPPRLPDPRPPGDYYGPRPPMTPRGEPTGIPEVAGGGRYL